jgi:hypothetical protein
MGVRLYVPAMGRFLQVDPVVRGSASAYDYARQDPINQFDLAGTYSRGGPSAILSVMFYRTLTRRVPARPKLTMITLALLSCALLALAIDVSLLLMSTGF